MDFTISEELQALRYNIRSFAEDVIEPKAQEIEENDKIPEEIIEQAKALGLFGMSIPEKYGGTGLNLLERCIILEELGRTQNG